MNELLIRTAAPALALIVEVEAPTRLVSTANGPADEERLAAWLDASPARAQAVAWALLDRDRSGGAERQRAWTRLLAADGGGIIVAVEGLLGELHEAEALAHHARGRFTRLSDRLRSLTRRG